ncbi:formate dehydrogenase-N subunit alpha [Desulfolutivibrio sulfoxidireducens]|uniref:formate dehydrogenase-N subunit alpha n=1 Tax=Desulfolutivibrio sulfoxidireducens TaxID=2773299 RepID=UPI00159D50C4|nr:formate dehydrogenase-N subunit alpha [Desulfolutivibrio sulfoxidireducens]QLA15515.1 formate dehydrogenase-N subunit alpha [Desulfolutivibrio sulfoxidireducens]QLA19113.1 formate dehydrogenase-N subunit alpha [Desulfolutivibrio sulfoxidireducens]
MGLSRRGFLKVTGASVAGLALGRLGIDMAPVSAYAAGLKIEGCKEFISICPFCSCCCNVLVHSKDGKIINIEGDPDYPISGGGLCAKGASLKSLHTSPERLTKPLYRAPGSDKWEEKDWNWMLDRIATRIKETRDRDFKQKNEAGQVVNRVESMFHLGSSQVSNEEAAVLHQMIRALGIVHFDHQARICHSATVPALAESFGRGAMTNHYTDIQNADAILIMGSNCAEHHPMTFKWVIKAKEKGAVVMHVDPKFSRTSARSTFHVPIRSGTDIAFLGGMVKYILENKKYFEQYMMEYTNAAFIVGEKFAFNDGLFSGFDAKGKKYDKSAWAFEKDEAGLPKRDTTLKHPRCVYNLLKKHYDRYDTKTVSSVTGVSEKDILRVYEAYAATGRPDKAGTVIYALGWTQHSVGVQNIRLSAMVQLLLGNIGIAGGGINALRGEPNVQGTTDHALLYGYLPGYHNTPTANLQTLEEYLKAETPVTKDPKSVNWWSNRPKYVVSLLKAWYGDNATKDNGFCYSLVPKLDPGMDCSHLYIFDRMYKGTIKGGLIFGHNPAQSVPNTHKVRKALNSLDWLVMGDVFHNETTDNWRAPGFDPKNVKTEVFLLPSAYRAEKDGTVSNSGRWHMWHYKAADPLGLSRDMGTMFVDIMNRVKALYAKNGGTFPDPILKQDYPEKFDADAVAKKCNGWFTQDVKIGDKEFKKGQQVPGFAQLAADGSTVSLCWVYAGGYPDAGNLAKRRDLTQTPMQAKIAMFPGFAWAWPMNRRVLYNRASVDPSGKPYNPEKVVIAWEDGKWVGDVPDGGAPPMAMEKGTYPFIMTTEGRSQLYGPGRADGPFPEHYEPAETPLSVNPFSKQMNNPCMKVIESDMDKLAKNADPRFPIVLTSYSLTEHWCSGSETRNGPALLEAEPQQYIEMSHELAKEKGIANGDVVEVESLRGKVQAVAMVTVRIRPFQVAGKTLHLVGMPFAFGWTKPKCGDSINRLTVSIGDPNTTIPEYKACLVNLRKAETVTEL